MNGTSPLITASSLGGLARLAEAEIGKRASNQALSDSGLHPNSPLSEGYFVPEASIVKFLGRMAHQTGDSLLGAKLGMRRDVGTQQALWGSYVTDALTLGEALNRLDRTTGVCFSNYRGLSLDTTGQRAWLRYRFVMREQENYVQTAMGWIASTINTCRYFAGRDWFPDVIEIDAPAPSTPSALEEILPTAIRFNTGSLGIAFPREILTLQRQADVPLSHTTFSEAVRAGHHSPPRSFQAVIEEIIRMQIKSRSVSLDAAARSLNLGVRTVQRKLDQTGHDFRSLTKRIRMDIACELVTESDVPLAAIAESVGFANQFNFSRAFHRHFGRPPSEIRKLASAHGGLHAPR